MACICSWAVHKTQWGYISFLDNSHSRWCVTLCRLPPTIQWQIINFLVGLYTIKLPSSHHASEIFGGALSRICFLKKTVVAHLPVSIESNSSIQGHNTVSSPEYKWYVLQKRIPWELFMNALSAALNRWKILLWLVYQLLQRLLKNSLPPPFFFTQVADIPGT